MGPTVFPASSANVRFPLKFQYRKFLKEYRHLIVVRRFEYAGDPESYTSGSVATGRASLAGQVKG